MSYIYVHSASTPYIVEKVMTRKLKTDAERLAWSQALDAAYARASEFDAKHALAQQYHSPDGRIWWIDEAHPQTSKEFVVARVVEGGRLMHTALWGREELTPIEDYDDEDEMKSLHKAALSRGQP
jgi:hypothetical protein